MWFAPPLPDLPRFGALPVNLHPCGSVCRDQRRFGALRPCQKAVLLCGMVVCGGSSQVLGKFFARPLATQVFCLSTMRYANA